jgi:hypothetical protein
VEGGRGKAVVSEYDVNSSSRPLEGVGGKSFTLGSCFSSSTLVNNPFTVPAGTYVGKDLADSPTRVFAAE